MTTMPARFGIVRRARPALLSLGIFFMLTGPAAAQHLGRAADDDVSMWRVFAALLLCLMLAVGGAFVLRMRFGTGQILPLITKQSRRLKLIESLRLGQQSDLCIVICDGRELLVSVSPHGVQLLADLAPGASPKSLAEPLP